MDGAPPRGPKQPPEAIGTADRRIAPWLGVLYAIEVSKATMRNIRQNLFGAFIYNSAGIPVAAGVFYPLFGWLLSPLIAGAAMAFSSVTVATNANRLRLFRSTAVEGEPS